MTLSELKPRGYHLSDVEPFFEGMPIKEWQWKMLSSQGEAHRETKKAKAEFSEQKWHKKAPK